LHASSWFDSLGKQYIIIDCSSAVKVNRVNKRVMLYREIENICIYIYIYTYIDCINILYYYISCVYVVYYTIKKHQRISQKWLINAYVIRILFIYVAIVYFKSINIFWFWTWMIPVFVGYVLLKQSCSYKKVDVYYSLMIFELYTNKIVNSLLSSCAFHFIFYLIFNIPRIYK
jgi:hypothetical protein